MKILLITDNHTPTGGAENYFFSLKQKLKTLPNTEVYSLGFGPEEKTGHDYFIMKGLTSNAAKLLWRVLLNPFVYLRLKKKIHAINPDIIHLHNVKQYSLSVLKAIKPYPVVQTIHDYGAVCPVAYNIHQDLKSCETGFRWRCFWAHHVKHPTLIYLALVGSFYQLTRQLKKTAKVFFAPSPQLVDYLTRNGFKQATYIPPFKNIPKALAFEKINPTHFLFAGNLGAHKGVHLLLDEFHLALQSNAKLTLTILGSGPESASLQQKIIRLGLEKQIFLAGWQADIEPFYQEAAAIIFPSLWMEAFGLVITEAMSYARPVIGSNRGSPPWLINHQETGYIFDPLKQGDLAEKILHLAANPELSMQLGGKGHEKLQVLLDDDQTLAKIMQHYQKCAKLTYSTKEKSSRVFRREHL